MLENIDLSTLSDDDKLYTNNTGRKSFQWELWQYCNSLCKFCYLGEDNRIHNKKRQLQSLKDLNLSIDHMDFEVYNNISLIGGEFFQGQLNDPEIYDKFFSTIKRIFQLYLDKKIKFEGIVQAFSRTNRIFGKDKPNGIIKYYRYPHTMERNIKEAFDLYSGQKPFGVFVEKLESNLISLNNIFTEIKHIFKDNGINNFEKNPESMAEKRKFAQLFHKFYKYLESARIQGFVWNQTEYIFKHDDGTENKITTLFDETTYKILALRYKEVFYRVEEVIDGDDEIPFDIDSTILEIDTDKIDADYMDSKFKKYLKVIHEEEATEVLDELHRTFATLTQEEQKFAELILSDIQMGKLKDEDDKTFRDYINKYYEKKKNDEIHRFCELLGFDEAKVRELMLARPNDANLDEYGKFEELMQTLDEDKCKAYFEARDGKKYPKPMIRVKADELARKFFILGGIMI